MTAVEFENWILWLTYRRPVSPRYKVFNWIKLPQKMKDELCLIGKEIREGKQ